MSKYKLYDGRRRNYQIETAISKFIIIKKNENPDEVALNFSNKPKTAPPLLITSREHIMLEDPTVQDFIVKFTSYRDRALVYANEFKAILKIQQK